MTNQGAHIRLARLWMRFIPVQLVILMGVIGFTAGVLGTMSVLLLNGDFNTASIPVAGGETIDPGQHVVVPIATQISSIFTPEVQHWAARILAWGKQYDIDPNLIATVMQIESCGDAQVGSSAGAMGLFQVMPFHFQDGEDPHDPDTNARAGIGYLKGGLALADGHPGLALAGYNGGYGMISAGWASWPEQTRLYYEWGSAIYLDALNGHTTSAALQNWLDSGGVNLCRGAAERLTPTVPAANATPTPSA